MLTKTIDDKAEIIHHRESIARCPVLVQEYIGKKFDIRVVVIGEENFAFEIHSQENLLSKHDFRGVAPNFLKHSVHILPEEINQLIQSFVQKQGLIFSAIDFVLSTNDEYYFLENNPNGQWLWLQLLTDVNLTERMINLLFT
jgi:glutathione synthase/RimK-type ligase-like ATP-grasp enzyme